MLYPRENRETKSLEFACNLCSLRDTNVSGSCVYEYNVLRDTSTRLENVLSDLNKDPTLQRSKEVECPNCSHYEAVFFQAEVTAKSTRLTVVYICVECGFKWMDKF